MLNEVKQKNDHLLKENKDLNNKCNNTSNVEKELNNKIQKLQQQCESIINQRSTEFKEKLQTLDNHSKNLREKNEQLMQDNIFYKKYYQDNQNSINNLQERNQELEDEVLTLKENSNDIKMAKERNMLKLCMLETMNQVLGRNMMEVDETTLDLLEIDKDRVKLHNSLDQI